MGSDRPKAVVSWSSGKDAAFALWRVREEGALDIIGLLTTLSKEYGRVSMHGVREELLDRQASAVGLPLHKVEIPTPCSNAVYDRAMAGALDRLRRESVTHVVFGDLFLSEVRAYRESRLAPTGMTPVFPLWGESTAALATEMVESGLEARIVCVDPRKLPGSFAGRRFDRDLLRDLPRSVDPCGENGEFHTCVTGGPMFDRSIPVRPGPTVERDGFVFSDLLPT
jgi:uncharacterized protein (TIGR00290 family)